MDTSDDADNEQFEGPDAPLSFVVPEEQVESLKQRSGKGGLGKIGVPGSIKTYKKRVESTSQWASKAARKTAGLPQKNINNAKKSIAKRLKSDADEAPASPSPSPAPARKKHLKPSGGSMPSAQVRSMMSLSLDGEEARQAQRPSKLSVESGNAVKSERDPSPKPINVHSSKSIPLTGSMGCRTASFDDLVMQEARETVQEQPLSPIQSHTYLLDSDDNTRPVSPHRRAFLRSSSDGRPRMKFTPPAARNESIPASSLHDSRGTGDENSDCEQAEDDRSLDGDEYGGEEIFEADEEDEIAGSPEYAYLVRDEELLGVSAEPDRERKNFNKLILSIPKGATKKSRKAGNYLLNVPKGVKSSVATGMDRGFGVAALPGKKVSRMVKAHNDTNSGMTGQSPEGGVTVAQAPVSSEELLQFLQAGTQDGKFVKAVPPDPEVVGSHKKKSLVRSVRGSKNSESGKDKKQLRQEVAGIKQSIDQFNRAVMSSLDASRNNADQLQKFSSFVETTSASSEIIRNEGQQERLALHEDLAEVSKKLDAVIKAVQTQQRHIALVEGRLMTMQRYQATQVTLLGIIYMLVNWIVVGMSLMQAKLVTGYKRARGTLPPPSAIPTIEDSPMVQDVTDGDVDADEEVEPLVRKRSNAIQCVDPVKFGSLDKDDEAPYEVNDRTVEEAQKEDNVLMASSKGSKKQEWPEDAPPPSVASVAAAHAAGIQAQHERLLRQRAEGRQGSSIRLRPSFANSKHA